MDWSLDKNRPICPQIAEKICVMIAKSEVKPEERLLSVREVALLAGVNPNTVQKSFEMLETQQLIYSVRGSGWFVSQNTDEAKNNLKKLISDKTRTYFDEMHGLGQNDEEIKKIVEEWRA